jgi:hypothetical protein
MENVPVEGLSGATTSLSNLILARATIKRREKRKKEKKKKKGFCTVSRIKFRSTYLPLKCVPDAARKV